ncbi:UPF0102 protein [Pseudoclavibacter endophyticus]|nr:UPF0102 protein [Pseudoclavibacter endophyticus]
MLGRRGEELAAAFLAAAGHEIIARNWRCAYGEIDLITRDASEIVFVEVKTRSSTGKGHPLEAITPEKLARLRRLAGAWIAVNPHRCQRIRLDAVGIVAPRGRSPEFHHRRAIGA